jgi:hypothetical protein
MITSLILAAAFLPNFVPRDKVHLSSIPELNWSFDERLATGGFSFILPKGWSKHPLGKWTDLWLNKDGDITADIIRSANSEQEIMNKYWLPQGGQFLSQESVKNLTLGFNSVISRRGTYSFGGKTWGMHLCVVKVGSQYVYGKLITSSMNSFEAESVSMLELFGSIDEVNPKPKTTPVAPPKNPYKQPSNSEQNSNPSDSDFRTGDLLNETAPKFVDGNYVPKIGKPVALSGWIEKAASGAYVFEHSKTPSGSDYTLTISPPKKSDRSPLQIASELWDQVTSNNKKRVANSFTENKFGWTVLTETAEFSIGQTKFAVEVKVLARNGYVMTSTGVTDGFYNLQNKSAQAHTILDRALSSDDPASSSTNQFDERIQEVSNIAVQLRTASNPESLLSKAATLCGFTVVDVTGKVKTPATFPPLNCEISEETLRSYARMFKNRSRVSKDNLYGAYDALTASIGFKINTKAIMSQALAFSMQSKNSSKRTFAHFISLLDMDHDGNSQDYFDPAQALLLSHVIQHDLAMGEARAYLQAQAKPSSDVQSNQDEHLDGIFASKDGPSLSKENFLTTQLDTDLKEWILFIHDEGAKKYIKTAHPFMKTPLKVLKYFKMLNKVADFVNIISHFEHSYDQSPNPFPLISSNGQPNDQGRLRASFYINGSTFQNSVNALQKSFPEIKFVVANQERIPLKGIMTSWNILDRANGLAENEYLYLNVPDPTTVLANPEAIVPIRGKGKGAVNRDQAIPVLREVPITITGQAVADGMNDILTGAKPILKLIPNVDYITNDEYQYTDSTIKTPSVSSPGVAIVEGSIHLITEFLLRCKWEPFRGYETVKVLEYINEPVVADVSIEINENFSATDLLYSYSKNIRRRLSSQALPLQFFDSNENKDIAMIRLRSAQTVAERKLLEKTLARADAYIHFKSSNKGVITRIINDLNTANGPDGDCAWQGTFSSLNSTKSLTNSLDLAANKNEQMEVSVKIDLKSMVARILVNGSVPIIRSYNRNTTDSRSTENRLGAVKDTRDNESMFSFSYPMNPDRMAGFPVQLVRSVGSDGSTKVFGSGVYGFEVMMQNGKKRQGALNINVALRVPNTKK